MLGWTSIQPEVWRDLAVLQSRARAIVAQITEAAAQAGLANVSADILDAANRQRPLVESQLAGATAAAIRKRLSAAVVRGNDAELLALATAVGPMLDARKTAASDAADPETFQLFEAKSDLRAIAARWRDRTLDLAPDAAAQTERRVSDIERVIVRNFTNRNGADEFGFGQAWLGH